MSPRLPVAAAVTALVVALAGGCGPSTGGPGAAGPGGAAPTLAPPSAVYRAGGAPATDLPASLRVTVGTYHDGVARAGDYGGVPALGRLVVAFRARLDGQVYGQPLLVGGLILVATEQNYVYGIDPLTGQVRWRSAQLGRPVPQSDLPCGDIDPEGVTATPVWVSRTGWVYVVSELLVGSTVEHDLVALDPATGRQTERVRVDPPGQEADTEQARGALLAVNGYLYVSYGGLAGDCGQYHGYVVSVPYRGASLRVYRTPSAREGAVWAPPGPVADSHGDLYVAVGNGASTGGRWDHTDSVLELSPTLGLLGAFAPASWPADNADDLDLGSTSPSLLAAGVILQVGKRGVAYTVRGGDLRGVGSQLSAGPVCAGYGGTAVAGAAVYLPCSGGVAKVEVGPGGGVRVLWRQTGEDGSIAGSPVLGGALVVVTDQARGALDVLSQRSGALLREVPIGPVTRFATPLLAGSRVYVGTEAGLVGLTGL